MSEFKTIKVYDPPMNIVDDEIQQKVICDLDQKAYDIFWTRTPIDNTIKNQIQNALRERVWNSHTNHYRNLFP